MFRFLFLSFTAISGLVYGNAQLPSEARDAEHRPRLEKNILLSKKKSEREWVRDVHTAIAQANPAFKGLEGDGSLRLARHIVQVSRCYEIDPGVFSALVWRESNFKPQSTSETGAVGLTQMTFYGVHEVLDRSNPKAVRNLKYLSALVAKCNPVFFQTIRSTLDRELDLDTLLKWKHRIAKDPKLSLAFGAILLKIQVARSPENLKSAEKIYRYALEKYNGDPKVKEQFAEDVLVLSHMVGSSLLSSRRQVAMNRDFLDGSKFLQSILRL